MIVFEDQYECAKEEIQDAKEDCGIEAQIQDHWLERQQHERSVAGSDDGLQDRAIHVLDRGMPAIVACFVPHFDGLAPQDDWVVGLGYEEDQEGEHEASPDDQDVERPTPACVSLDLVEHFQAVSGMKYRISKLTMLYIDL